MTKGTQSFGKRHVKNHTACPRCGRMAYHIQKKACGACAFPSPKKRKYNWSKKSIRRKTTGTGKCSYLKQVKRRELHSWVPTSKVAKVVAAKQ